MVTGRDRRLHQGPGDQRRRLPRRSCRARSSSWRSATRTRCEVTPPGRHQLRGRDAQRARRRRRRQGAGRPDRRPHPPRAQAGAVQGQGHPLRRGADPAQGRQGRQGRRRASSMIKTRIARRPARKRHERIRLRIARHRRAAAAHRSSAARNSSTPRSSTTPTGRTLAAASSRRADSLGTSAGKIEPRARGGQGDRRARQGGRVSAPSCSTAVGTYITGGSPLAEGAREGGLEL